MGKRTLIEELRSLVSEFNELDGESGEMIGRLQCTLFSPDDEDHVKCELTMKVAPTEVHFEIWRVSAQDLRDDLLSQGVLRVVIDGELLDEMELSREVIGYRTMNPPGEVGYTTKGVREALRRVFVNLVEQYRFGSSHSRLEVYVGSILNP